MPWDIQGDGDLVTIANIPIAAVGEDWEASTGVHTVTPEDLQAAVAALADPSIKDPRVKLGHLDPRFTPDGEQGIFDGTPTLGKMVNMRVGDSGMTLYADAVGVPRWFAQIAPTAYPNRSMEGSWNVKTKTGHEHKFVVTAVAFIGDELPAIETLEDLPIIFSGDGPDWAQELMPETVGAFSGGRVPQRIAASTSIEDVRRTFFEDFATEESGRYWWWIRAAYVDPSILICSDGDENLHAVTYSVDGDSITFGDPVEVFTQYVEVGGNKVLASRVMATPAVHVFSKSGGSRPETTNEEAATMSVDIGALRTRLGLTEEQLPDDATEEQINEAIAAPAPGTSPDPAAVPANDTTPEPGTAEAGAITSDTPAEGRGALGPAGSPVQASAGTQVVDAETLANLQRDAALGREARQEQIAARRAGVIDGAIRAGKIPPARRDHYTQLIEADEEGTTQLLASLAEGLIPVAEHEVGSGNTPDATVDAGYDESWLSDGERQRIAAAKAGKTVQIVEA